MCHGIWLNIGILRSTKLFCSITFNITSEGSNFDVSNYDIKEALKVFHIPENHHFLHAIYTDLYKVCMLVHLKIMTLDPVKQNICLPLHTGLKRSMV
jgi:hypothetical protein